MSDIQSRLRELPQVSTLLEDSRIAPLLEGRRREWMTRVVQDTVAALPEERRRRRRDDHADQT